MTAERKAQGSRRSEHEWRSLLSRHQSSGQGIEAFCRSEQISAASFHRWRGLLHDGGDCGKEVGNNPAPAFVDLGALKAASSPRSRIDLKLDLGDGLVLHLVRHRCSSPKARCGCCRSR